MSHLDHSSKIYNPPQIIRIISSFGWNVEQTNNIISRGSSSCPVPL